MKSHIRDLSDLRDEEFDEMPSKRCRFITGKIVDMEGQDTIPPSLISVQILHRHGSRGPGESELSPWTGTDCFISSQWESGDLENITSIGHQQCKDLGRYFAKTLKNKMPAIVPKVFWRCSKSERAKESGFDFIDGYYENTTNIEEKLRNPTPYNENADNYFRPWKTVQGFSEAIKLKMSTSNIWSTKAEENRLFLEKIYQQVEASKVTEKITKALWSTTYLYSAKECEDFWPQPGKRHAITDVIPDEEDWRKITELACWVWEERFIRNEYIIKMGGKLLRDMIQQSLNPDYNISFYSGHDYTILSLLSILGMQNIKEPASFACYIMIELWDAPPPPHPSPLTNGSTCNHNQQLLLPITNRSQSNMTDSDISDQRVFRVLFNPKPFLANEKEFPLPVHHEHEVVLGVYKVQEMLDLVSIIDEVYVPTATTPTTPLPSTPTLTNTNSEIDDTSSTIKQSSPESILPTIIPSTVHFPFVLESEEGDEECLGLPLDFLS